MCCDYACFTRPTLSKVLSWVNLSPSLPLPPPSLPSPLPPSGLLGQSAGYYLSQPQCSLCLRLHHCLPCWVSCPLPCSLSPFAYKFLIQLPNNQYIPCGTSIMEVACPSGHSHVFNGAILHVHVRSPGAALWENPYVNSCTWYYLVFLRRWSPFSSKELLVILVPVVEWLIHGQQALDFGLVLRYSLRNCCAFLASHSSRS